MKTTERKTALIASILLVLLCILLTKTYRPFIYKNNLNDFHLADTLSSWICVPAGSLFFWSISNAKFIKCLICSLLGFLAYEFIGLTFDWFDIIVLFLSGGITYLVYIVYKRKVLKNYS